MTKICSMTDIEAVGTTGDTGILSVSTVIFDFEDPQKNYIDEFTTYLDVKDQIERLGRTFSKDTMDWWKKQDPAVFKSQFAGKTKIEDGLTSLLSFFDNHECDWHFAKGVHFDMAILKDACHSLNLNDHPFIKEFWKWQCCATIGRQYEYELGEKWLVNNMTRKYNKEFGASHDPLVDCKIQIEILKDFTVR